MHKCTEYKMYKNIQYTKYKMWTSLCAGDSKAEFDAHMRLHFDHRCPFCDYSSRTEGRLRCHIKTFHADGGLCSGAPVTAADQAAKRKPKIITCQKCGFKAKEKVRLAVVPTLTC